MARLLALLLCVTLAGVVVVAQGPREPRVRSPLARAVKQERKQPTKGLMAQAAAADVRRPVSTPSAEVDMAACSVNPEKAHLPNDCPKLSASRLQWKLRLWIQSINAGKVPAPKGQGGEQCSRRDFVLSFPFRPVLVADEEGGGGVPPVQSDP